MRRVILPVSLLWPLINLCLGCQNQVVYKQTRVMLGTFVEVISPDKYAGSIAFSEIKRIENLLSKYNPESEISKLNALGELRVSPETFFVIKKSQEISLASSGAFDITVAPLVDLWGFTDNKFNFPQDGQIQKTLKLVGSEKILLNDNDNVVKFSLPGMKIDLGGIAKGYALDCALNKLKTSGIKNCLINAGGQVSAMGDKYGKPWRAAIQDPRGNNFTGVLELKDNSISTSGDYQQFFYNKGVRYAHILDPKTGRPARSGVISVTVSAPCGLIADALSTAVFVLGRQKGRELLSRFPQSQIEAIRIDNDE